LAFLAQNAVLITCSTPGYTENTILSISRKKDKYGKLICCTVDYSFECQDCREAQKTDPRIVCECFKYRVPKHIMSHSVEIAELAMGDENRDAFLREIKGVTISNECKLLTNEKVDYIFERPRFVYSRDKKPPEFVFICCDPNGASNPTSMIDKNSKFAIVTLFTYESEIVVRYIDIFCFSFSFSFFFSFFSFVFSFSFFFCSSLLLLLVVVVVVEL